MAGIWQKATLSGTAPGSRVQVDAAGMSWVRFLSPSFMLNDGVDYGFVGWGCDIIQSG
ncbi:hypothetical protein [Bradyrhizobium sp. USDA 3458]|uniref:hypothetical protein n=1 Tax=Bradyrhizobium sp. USDA 3458 TaxID=2591461 RepID=UPI00132FCD8D|nr:hypothetical protein [Bradyrhizobium sp. USDA 3458]